MDEILPFPGSVALNTKHHLRPQLVQDLLEQAGSIKVKDARKGGIDGQRSPAGHLFAALLVAALIRDRQRVSRLAARISQAPPKERGRLASDVSFLRKNLCIDPL